MAKKHIHDKRKKDLIFYVVMLSLPLLQFSIFYLGVNFNSILMAFQKFDDTAKEFVFLDFSNIFKNFTDVFRSLGTETVFPYALKNSLISYVVSLIAGTGLALIFSYYVYKKFPLHGLVKVVLFTPSIISGMVLVSVFVEFVNVVIPGISQLTTGEEMIGFITNPPTSKTFGTILFYCIWIGFGGSILLYVGAMNNISESVSEACKLDGANLFQEMIYIVIPLIYPTFVTFMVVGVGGIFTNQMGLYSFFGPGADETLQTFGYYLFKRTKAASESDYPFLATMGILMTMIVAPLTFLVKWALEKAGPKLE
ncbi:MAG: sugar ABC transporter permease [Clostridia bacterium]|nr:sugar ABC transporter permease [Clostridia bacterium]